MKTNFIKIFILSVFLVFTACSSDGGDSAECQTIACQNGGVFENCECLCPEGFFGTDCSSQITPTKIKVTKIRVKYFPNTNNGSNWDVGGLPDIFVRLGKGNGDNNTQLLYTSNVIENAVSNGVNVFDFVPTTATYITNVTQQHVVILGDYDTASYNDFMGGFTFTPYNNTNRFPASILLQDANVPLSFELFLTYEF